MLGVVVLVRNQGRYGTETVSVGIKTRLNGNFAPNDGKNERLEGVHSNMRKPRVIIRWVLFQQYCLLCFFEPRLPRDRDIRSES